MLVIMSTTARQQNSNVLNVIKSGIDDQWLRCEERLAHIVLILRDTILTSQRQLMSFDFQHSSNTG